jgi:cytochrome c biogenesis protein CcmG/thiol:disulfide interchange protein DsbE
VSDAVAAGPRRGRSRRVRWIALVAGVALVFVVLVLASQVGTDPTKHTSRLLGKPAPASTLPTLVNGKPGQTISIDSLRGKAVIVNFWNTWCIPCRQEAPALKQFAANEAGDSSVVLLGIVRDDDASSVKAHDATDATGWITALDPGSKAALAWGTTGQPETYAISPDGVVVGYQLGPVTVANLQALLNGAQNA